MVIQPHLHTSRAARTTDERAPSILYACGLIVLYFLLQISSSGLIRLVLEIWIGFEHGDLLRREVEQRVTALLQRPDNSALQMCLSLPLIALWMLWFVRQAWLTHWSSAKPPGFGFTAARSNYWYVLALLLSLAMLPIGGALTHWLAHGHEVTQNVKELGSHVSHSLRWPLILVAMVVGPTIEELLFRGVLLSALIPRISTTGAIFLSAVAFALVHLAGLDFQWYALPQLILFAVLLGWLRVKSASLWPAIIAHGFYNGLAMLALFTL